MSDTTTCPSCGKEMATPAGAEVYFCSECGQKLQSEDTGQDNVASEAEPASESPASASDEPEEAPDAPNVVENAAPDVDTTKKKMSSKTIAIVGGCIAAAAIAIALVLFHPWAPDAARAGGKLPNIPAVMSQVDSWDDAKWAKSMNLESASSGSAADLVGTYRSFGHATITRDDGKVSVAFWDQDEANGAASVISYRNEPMVYFTDAVEISGLGSSDIAYLTPSLYSNVKNTLFGLVLNEENDAHDMLSFGRDEAKEALKMCSIDPDAAEGRIELINSTDDLQIQMSDVFEIDSEATFSVDSVSGSQNIGVANPATGYHFGCIAKDVAGKDLYVTVDATRSSTAYIWPEYTVLSSGEGYAPQVFLTPERMAQVQITASYDSSHYDEIASGPGAKIMPSGLTVDMPYYTVTLPSDWAGEYSIEKNEELGDIQETAELRIGSGCSLRVEHDSGESFEICCFTNGWGMQGDAEVEDLGSPSNLSDWHVQVIVWNANGADFEKNAARAKEYAKYVTLK